MKKVIFNKNLFAINLKNMREKSGKSQEDLAVFLAPSGQIARRDKVSRWELAKGLPETKVLPLIAQFLNLSIGELFKGNASPKGDE